MQLLKQLYDWVLSWAHKPHGSAALFALAFAESSFFPIPPDVLLIALGISVPMKAFRYAALCSLGSVLGGTFGYLLGLQFWELASGILFRYIDQDGFETVRRYFNEHEAWAVGIAGFTPIPYKVFTITAGFMRSDFTVFLIASALSRSARFFLVSLLIYRYGASIRTFIDKYFNLLTILFTVLLVGGFVIIKYFLRG